METGEQGASQIQLVDHTNSLATTLRTPLTDAGFSVRTVESAGESLARLEDAGIDAIISRYSLADLDGI